MELFENALQTGGIWKRWLFVIVWTEKILKTELFELNEYLKIIMWFPSPRFFNTNPKWPLLNLSGEVWAENIWRVFRAKPSLSDSSQCGRVSGKVSSHLTELRADSPWVFDRTLRQTTVAPFLGIIMSQPIFVILLVTFGFGDRGWRKKMSY